MLIAAANSCDLRHTGTGTGFPPSHTHRKMLGLNRFALLSKGPIVWNKLQYTVNMILHKFPHIYMYLSKCKRVVPLTMWLRIFYYNAYFLSRYDMLWYTASCSTCYCIYNKLQLHTDCNIQMRRRQWICNKREQHYCMSEGFWLRIMDSLKSQLWK